MSKARDFGVQSYCFRHYKDNAEVAAKVREIGLDKIEICNVHANLKDPKSFGEVVKTYTDAGITIVSMGVETFNGDPDAEQTFRCAALAGIKHISCHFQANSYIKAIPMVRAWARKYGVRVGIHCHGGYHFNGNLDTLKHLIGLGAPEIGVWIDTAWCMQIGPNQGKPVEWIRKHFPGQVYGIHYKDFVFERNGAWKDVIVGQGNLDLPAVVAALEETGFDGVTLLEYEGNVENPVPALKECVASMRALMA
ncbi:MAG TPA: sugar phosphate isomerase/epimerase [Oceanipulchritudo sp.]|nr:sugar phosphate isomerase/epimerase [Oceanipulchritudo sp.]